MDVYRDDLAYIHDAGYGSIAQNAAGVLLDDLRKRGIDGGRVLDLGCGSGILSEQLAAAGFDSWGVDISPGMVQLARARVPNGTFHEGSLWTAQLPACVAAAAVGEAFNYLFDGSHTVAELGSVLQRIYAVLEPGGVLIFDVAEPGRVPRVGPVRSYREGADWAVLVTSEEDPQEKVLTRQITSFRKVGELYRRDHEVHRQRLLPRTEVAEQLQGVGFQVQVLAGYGALAFPPGLVGFLAHKPISRPDAAARD